ncbi:hypothetical protein [Magnetospira sp. QH-2]|nr:hypothetical protein [Magnetospira sp. QH-2]
MSFKFFSAKELSATQVHSFKNRPENKANDEVPKGQQPEALGRLLKGWLS